MKIAGICFSRKGLETGKNIKLHINHDMSIVVKSRNIEESTEDSLSQWTEKAFAEADCLIFIGSCGIAVRAIAPYVNSKKTDPAVIVVDEIGNFVISLLSGHLGGANELTVNIAKKIGAESVITTASEVNGKLAPDTLAKINGFVIDDMTSAKIVAASIVNGDKVAVYTDMDVEGIVPDHFEICDIDNLVLDDKVKIVISTKLIHRPTSENTLLLIPRVMHVGIGCRRNTPTKNIKKGVYSAFERIGVDRRAIAMGASIDLKADENGMLRFFDEENLPLKFFSGEELMATDGDFSKSEFVRNATGVDCVCERSAIASGGDILVLEKTVYDKVTVAIAEKKGILKFE